MSAKRSDKCDSDQQNGSSGEGLNSPQTPPGRVLFTPDGDEDSRESRKDASRFLTAKYQKQQMGMIRKRIAIEDWIEEELYTILKKDEDEEDDDLSLDLDEILSIQGDDQRVEYVKNKLSSLPRASDPTSVGTFTKSLIEKLQELK